MKNFRQQLEEKFASEDVIGVYEADYSSGLTLQEFNEEGFDRDFEGLSYLPDGTEFARCTNSADYVVRTMGEGVRYGFMVEDNPTVTDKEIQSVGGHDFAVLRNRFIVDLWISHFVGSEKQFVFDLWDKKDSQKIQELYGDPKCWSLYDPINDIAYEASNVPADKQLSIGKPKQGLGFGM